MQTHTWNLAYNVPTDAQTLLMDTSHSPPRGPTADYVAVSKFRLQKTCNAFFGKCILYNKVSLNVTKPLHKLKQTVKETLMKQGYYKVEDYLEKMDIIRFARSMLCKL
jgi:uncharacterized protein YcgL (UPF0745 family)